MGCGCNASGMGGAIPAKFPTLERVFAKWIADQLRAGNYYYISPELNSDVQRAQGVTPDMILGMYPKDSGLGQFEFLPAIFAAIGSIATTVGTTVASVAPAIGSIVGTVSSIQTLQAANSHSNLTSIGVQVPGQLAPQVTSAVKTDLLSQLGITPTMAILGVGGLLAVLMLTGKRR
jgi:hypothetical protein